MRRSPLRRWLLLALLCSGTGRSGCAELKVAVNSPSRTQRPNGFSGPTGRPTPPEDKKRERALDTFLRGRRPARPGPRPGGDVSEVEPQVGAVAQPSHSLDDVFDAPAPSKDKGRYHRMQR